MKAEATGFSWWVRRVFAAGLSCALACALVPVVQAQADPLGAAAGPVAGVAGLSDEAIGEMLARDCEEGQVVVCLDGDQDARRASRAVESSLLESAESLMVVPASTGNEAAPGARLANRALAPLARAQEATLDIALVKSDTMTTEQLIYALKDDPRVLIVEPNYRYQIEAPAETGQISPIEGLFESADFGEAAKTADSASAPAAALVAGEGSTPASPGAPSATDTALLPDSVASLAIKDLTAYQWAYKNDPTTLKVVGGVAGFDMNPPDWEKEPAEQANPPVVAVVDSGVDWTHPDLNICDTTAVQKASGLGGANGFNAVTGMDQTKPVDDYGHGTHCAGSIAAAWNGVGVSGIAKNVQVLPVKVGTAAGIVGLAPIISSYNYLVQACAAGINLQVTSNSWGTEDRSQALNVAITRLGELGVTTLFASGNEQSNLDTTSSQQALLRDNPYVVVVNSASKAAHPSEFTNYGATTSDVAAPGSDILSTVPQDAPLYLPEAVSTNAFYEDFNGATPAFGLYNGAREVGAVSEEYCFEGSKAYRVQLSDLKKQELPQIGTAYLGLSSPLALSAGFQDQKNKHVALRFYAPSDTPTVVQIVLNPQENGGVQLPRAALTSKEGWVTLAADLAPYEIDYSKPVQVGLLLLRQGAAAAEPGEYLYIDTVGFGPDAVPYDYYSGTSMATPATAGAAAILAAEEPVVATDQLAQAAQKRTARVAGCVTRRDEFAKNSISEGYIDLTRRDNPLPVLRSAKVVADGVGAAGSAGSATATISGFFFGNTPGTVNIGGVDAPVSAWSDESITVAYPAALPRGLVRFEVAPAAGQAGHQSFLVEAGGTPADTPLFENEIALPSDPAFTKAFAGGALAGLGKQVYLLPMDAEGDYYQQLRRYTPATASWVCGVDLPEKLMGVSTATYEGKLFAYGKTVVEPGDTAQPQPRLYAYDPQADLWENRAARGLSLDATIANCAGELLFVGGAVLTQDPAHPQADPESTPLASIVRYDAQTGAVSAVGALANAYAQPAVTVRGADLYVAGNKGFEEVVNYQGHVVAPLPAAEPTQTVSFALAPVEEGTLLTGLLSADGASDTYLLAQEAVRGAAPADAAATTAPVAAAAFAPYTARVSSVKFIIPAALAYEGQFYVLGISAFEPGGYVFRSTAANTLPQAGDIPAPQPPAPDPSPDPTPQPLPTAPASAGNAAILPKVGDTALAVPLVCLLAAAGGMLALAVARH
ncbi:MAG: S8 family serine peptidase, partial [Raoultibacter sp.]